MNQGDGREVDPVCGMKVDPARAAGQHAHAGVTYYFCGKGCLEKFRLLGHAREAVW